VANEDGTSGETIGDWLVKMGLDINRGALAASTAVSRRRFPNRRTHTSYAMCAAVAALQEPAGALLPHSGAPGRAAVRKRHRADCTCIICKQARRKGGMVGGGPDDLVVAQAPLVGTAGAPERAGGSLSGRPAFRTGKNAFVHSTPYLPRGSAGPGEDTFATPPARAWHAGEWATYCTLRHDVLARQSAADAAAAAAAAQADADAEGERANGGAGAAAPAAVDDALMHALQPPGPRSALPRVVEQGALARLGVHPLADTPGPWRLGIPSLHDKVEMCRATEDERLTVNKSGIHGWGLTALQDIQQVRCQRRRRALCRANTLSCCTACTVPRKHPAVLYGTPPAAPPLSTMLH
jgi:hypothetical protein